MTSWGILAPEYLASKRRQQSLGLAAATRHFNDAAVPGLGGMWFPMPLVWSVLAVSIANELRIPALPVGNAIEALIMGKETNGKSDNRVRGVRKLSGNRDWTFEHLKKRGTYVVQPTRMAMVQPLVALRFVQGSRYGAFRISTAGERMLDLPDMQENRRILFSWVKGKNPNGLGAVAKSLSPKAKVPDATAKLIKARLLDGDDDNATRRRNLVTLGKGPSARQLESVDPLGDISETHWSDLRAGKAFVDLRNAALAVLNEIERRLLSLRDNNEPVRLSLQEAVKTAGDQLDLLCALAKSSGYAIAAGAEVTSQKFLTEVQTLSRTGIIQKLAERDGTVVCWRQDHLALGPAAGSPGKPPEVTKDTAEADFAPQLFRLFYLHCLATELAGAENPGVRQASVDEQT